MARRKKVVRVVLPDGIHDANGELRTMLECFRYAGLISMHRDDEAGMCFDLHCPHGLVDQVWAEQNAARMRSFSYNAVVAPCGRPTAEEMESLLCPHRQRPANEQPDNLGFDAQGNEV